MLYRVHLTWVEFKHNSLIIQLKLLLKWPMMNDWCLMPTLAIFSYIVALAYFIYYLCQWFMIDWFLVFNATFSNISAISWWPVLVVDEAGVPRENHWPWASNW
jgi:hypothetical protein